MKLLRKLIIVVTVLAFMFSPLIVFAEEDNDTAFSFGPTSQRISLSPGESYRSSVNVSSPNTSSRPTDFILYTAPYSITNQNYEANFDQESTYTQIKDWIILDRTEGTVKPNENLEIGFTIKVPEDAPAGGQYGVIVAQDVTGLGDGRNDALNISSISAIGSVIVADIAGETRAEGEILSNQVPSMMFTGPLTTDSVVRNNGNVHTDASYVLQVWPLFSNEEICTNEENPDTRIILPDTERYYSQSCDLPPVGIFRVKQIVKIFGETSIVEKTIIVCPIWLLFIIIFVIFALIFYFVAKAKARKKAAKKAEKSA